MPDRPYLIVATPCFGGQVTTRYTESLLKLQWAAVDRAVDLGCLMLGGDALITRARANLVASFLARPNATHLLFVDADIGFEPEQVFRLLNFDADVTAAAYPAKSIDWQRYAALMAEGHARPEAASLRYVMGVAADEELVLRDGFVKAHQAGTGFLMIRRLALERLCAAHPELQFRRVDSPADPLADSPHRFALFDCMIDPKTGVYLSEDFAFCRRWTRLGGEIWIDTRSKLTHVGVHEYAGDFATQFMPSS